jgi:hypothetical protein
MILHWEQLVLHYDSALNQHRPRFEQAGQTTYGLLCCRYSPTEDELGYSASDHAEANLLRTALWTAHLPSALRAWTPHDSGITVTLAINRSPCRNCTVLLINALSALYRNFPARGPRNRFILAAKGAYEDAGMTTRAPRRMTCAACTTPVGSCAFSRSARPCPPAGAFCSKASSA